MKHFNDQCEEILNCRIKLSLYEFEGYRQSVYRDSLGYLTLGVGHKLTNKELNLFDEYDIVSYKYTMKVFNEDIDKAKTLAKSIYKNFDDHNEDVKLFMVLQAFNMGNNLKKFVNSNRALVNKEYSKAYKGFKNSLWCRQVHTNRCTKVTNLLKGY